jgi:hypothetical protein
MSPMLFAFKPIVQTSALPDMRADTKISNMLACILHMFLGRWSRQNGWVSLKSRFHNNWLIKLTSKSTRHLATGPVVPSLIGGLLNTLTLPLFIFAAGPVSGGHVNPTITMATFFARLSTFPRSILYISFQLLGATVAGYLLRGSFDTRSVSIYKHQPLSLVVSLLALLYGFLHTQILLLNVVVCHPRMCHRHFCGVSRKRIYHRSYHRFHAHLPVIQRGSRSTPKRSVWSSSWSCLCWYYSRNHKLWDWL